MPPQLETDQAFTARTNSSLREYENTSGRQIHFVPKTHPFVTTLPLPILNSKLNSEIAVQEVGNHPLGLVLPNNLAVKPQEYPDTEILEREPRSREYAWVIGALASGGHVGLNGDNEGTITYSSAQPELINKFASIGGQIFQHSGKTRRIPSEDPKGKDTIRLQFFSARMSHQLGDLRHTHWPTTIREQHGWIMENHEHIWGFLEGIFEKRGLVSEPEYRDKVIEFGTISPQIAELLVELLQKVGIAGAHLNPNKYAKEGVRGVITYRVSDVKQIAANIQVANPDRERKLAFLREFVPPSSRRTVSTGDLVTEWMTLKERLGHSPTQTEIDKLKRQGQTPYSHEVYEERFDDRSFVRGRREIERIIGDGQPYAMQTNIALRDYENATGSQLHYAHKTHRKIQDEDRRKANETLAKIAQEPHEFILFGPEGRPLYKDQKIEEGTSYVSQSERPQSLVQFVKQEIAEIEVGEIDQISSNRSLLERFGYAPRSNGAIDYHLRRAGLLEERRRILNESKHALYPSSDLAWILGLLSGGGGGGIASSGRDDLLTAFKAVAQNTFVTNVIEFESTIITQQERTYNVHSIIIPARVKKALGDLRADTWPDTLIDRHLWLSENSNYLWRFLEGYFEANGSIDVKGNKLSFNTSRNNAAILISDFLTLLGVKRPNISYTDAKRQEVRGVCISNLSDIKVVAQNLHSSQADREEKLASYRSLSLDSLPAQVASADEVVREWVRLRNILGHVPRITEVDNLRKESKTKFSSQVYINKLGGKWNDARKALEEIVVGQHGAEWYPLPTRASPHKNVPSSDLLDEYQRLKALLGHAPNAREIKELKRTRGTPYSLIMYVNRFGEGSYVKARENLERLIEERAAEPVIESPSVLIEQGQVFPDQSTVRE